MPIASGSNQKCTLLDEEKLRDAFDTAKARHTGLRSVAVDLRYENGWFFTMRACISLSSIFSQKRKYFVKVNRKRADIFFRLSGDDLVGWYGHELAHIIDYETMSFSRLLMFTLRYVFDIKFRFSVERRVNAFCYNNGFAKELFGVWKKFLAINTDNKGYQRYIIEHYRPAWESIKETAEIEGISQEVYESMYEK